jgi:hypothetical protein
MMDARLTDVKWMDPALAHKLDEADVTVAALASMSPQEFLKEHPYAGTINAWLLTSEAAWLLNMMQAGLWSPSERIITDSEAMAILLEIEEEQRRARYGRPEIPNWPPAVSLDAPAEKSVRVRRIEQGGNET